MFIVFVVLFLWFCYCRVLWLSIGKHDQVLYWLEVAHAASVQDIRSGSDYRRWLVMFDSVPYWKAYLYQMLFLDCGRLYPAELQAKSKEFVDVWSRAKVKG